MRPTTPNQAAPSGDDVTPIHVTPTKQSRAAAAAIAAGEPDRWAKENRAHVFATDVESSDLGKGYTSSRFPFFVIWGPLLAYGAFLLFESYKEQGLRELETSARLVYASTVAFFTASGNAEAVIALLVVSVVFTTVVLTLSPARVYLLDFAVFECPPDWNCDQERFHRQNNITGAFTEESLSFQDRIVKSSTLGTTTSFPPAIMEDKVDLTMKKARHEAKTVMVGAVEKVLRQTGVKPQDIDVVVVNCSLFSPTPSLSSILVNHFKMRSDILNYSLGGMGCSAGVIGVDLASRVLNMESMTQNWYLGNERSMMISNCIFRVGCSAVLLTNRRSLAKRAKFELSHVVRTHTGRDDEAYTSVYQCEDSSGVLGVRLARRIMIVAGDALRSNMTRLGPLVLPVSEQAKFILNLVGRKLTTGSLPIPKPMRKLVQGWWLFNLRLPIVGRALRTICRLPANVGEPMPPSPDSPAKKRLVTGKPYVPDFRKAFEFFCIHAGGRAVLDAIEKNLQLTKRDMTPSRATLSRYGNTSSSSVWYELDYVQRHMGMKKGDRVWQIAFGSGFMCNSAVWRALRPAAPGSFSSVSNHAEPFTGPE